MALVSAGGTKVDDPLACRRVGEDVEGDGSNPPNDLGSTSLEGLVGGYGSLWKDLKDETRMGLSGRGGRVRILVSVAMMEVEMRDWRGCGKEHWPLKWLSRERADAVHDVT